MGALCQRMEEDLKLKNYAPATRAEYLRCAKRFVAYHLRSPAEMGEREIRDFLLALAFEHAGPETLKMHVAALKFLYGTTLRIREACSLRAADVDSQRKLIHVRDGKRARDRYVPLPERLLAFLRE